MEKPTFNDWFNDTNIPQQAGDITSEKLFYNLTKELKLLIDDNIDWSKYEIPKELLDKLVNYRVSVSVPEVTTKDPDGTGAFDVFMSAIGKHLEKEFSEGRIVGADYATTYIAAVQMALQQAVEFVLKKDQTYLTGINAQMQAIASTVAVLNAKVALAKLKAETSTLAAQYANTKLQLSVIQEQLESARSNTLNTRTDGTTVVGTSGKQKDVMSQQIIAFKQKANIDAANIAANAWTVTKGVDEATQTPDSMNLNALNRIVDQVYANTNLPTVLGSTNNLNGSTPS